MSRGGSWQQGRVVSGPALYGDCCPGWRDLPPEEVCQLVAVYCMPACTGLCWVLCLLGALCRKCFRVRFPLYANSRHCHEAQAVLGVLLRHEAPDELLTYDGVRASLEGLLPYTGEWAGLGAGRAVRHTRPPLTACGPPPERHFQRLSRTLQAATFLDFLWHNMKLPTLPTAPVAL